MNLHLNKELFDQVVIIASDAMMINPEIIEKQKKDCILLHNAVFFFSLLGFIM